MANVERSTRCGATATLRLARGSFAADHSLIERSDSKQIVLVVSPDPAYRRFLHELLAAAGHSICEGTRADSHSAPTTILFDADPWDEAQADQVRSLHQ